MKLFAASRSTMSFALLVMLCLASTTAAQIHTGSVSSNGNSVADGKRPNESTRSIPINAVQAAKNGPNDSTGFTGTSQLSAEEGHLTQPEAVLHDKPRDDASSPKAGTQKRGPVGTSIRLGGAIGSGTGRIVGSLAGGAVGIGWKFGSHVTKGAATFIVTQALKQYSPI